MLPPERCSFVMGNPPFVGKQFAAAEQKADMDLVFAGMKGAGVLDYVTGWYMRAAQYIQGTSIRCAFVSTNSITQGEQVGVLWNELFRRRVKIHFAHRTFAWESEARGKAHVHVVIVGFGVGDRTPKRIYDYERDPDHAVETTVRNISPYLVEGGDVVVLSRSRPICDAPRSSLAACPTTAATCCSATRNAGRCWPSTPMPEDSSAASSARTSSSTGSHAGACG